MICESDLQKLADFEKKAQSEYNLRVRVQNKDTDNGEYTSEVQTYLRKREQDFDYKPFLNKPQEESARQLVMDQMINASHKYKFRGETIFMAEFLMDHYIARENVSKQNIQLVGIVSLMIAAKYEEIYPPSIHDFEKMAGKYFTRPELLKMESSILRKLGFNLSMASPLRHLEIYSKGIGQGNSKGITKKCFEYAVNLLEATLLNFKLLNYLPSVRASAALFLSEKFLEKSGATAENAEISSCATEIVKGLILLSESPNNLVKKKYSTYKELILIN